MCCVGDGLASTSAALNQNQGISDAGLFFEQVMSKPYLNQVLEMLLFRVQFRSHIHLQQNVRLSKLATCAGGGVPTCLSPKYYKGA